MGDGCGRGRLSHGSSSLILYFLKHVRPWPEPISTVGLWGFSGSGTGGFGNAYESVKSQCGLIDRAYRRGVVGSAKSLLERLGNGPKADFGGYWFVTVEKDWALQLAKKILRTVGGGP